MGATKDEKTTRKNGVNMILDARKGKNKITMFHLKEKSYSPLGLLPKEANINLPEEKEVQDGNNEKKYWRKKLGITREMDIHVAHQYLHLGEKLLRLIYYTLGINLTGMLHLCDGCARSKAKAHAIRKKTQTRASNPGERVFVNMTDSLPESLIGKCYFFVKVDNYRSYSLSFCI